MTPLMYVISCLVYVQWSRYNSYRLRQYPSLALPNEVNLLAQLNAKKKLEK
jgi:hypothetical protein